MYPQTFSPSDSHIIPHVVFLYQTLWKYPDGHPLTGRRMQGGYEKIAIFDQYIALSQKRYKMWPWSLSNTARSVGDPVNEFAIAYVRQGHSFYGTPIGTRS